MPHDWRTAVRRRLETLGLPPAREAEIVDEVAQHLADRYDDMVASGAGEREAEAAAWRELDAAGVLERLVHRVERLAPSDHRPPGFDNHASWWRALLDDISHTVRGLRRRPGYTLPVLAALMLSIGPATALVSLANWMLWRPVPGIAAPDNVGTAVFAQWFPEGGLAPAGVSYQNLADLRTAATTFTGIAGQAVGQGTLVLGDRPPEIVQRAIVTHDYFAVLGVRVVAGRSFLPDEDRVPPGAPVVVISHSLATSAFGSAEGALDQPLALDRKPFRVVGVVDPAFRGTDMSSGVSVWLSGATQPYLAGTEDTGPFVTRGQGWFSSFKVRRFPDRSWNDVEQELALLTARLATQYPGDNTRFTAAGRRLAVTPRVMEARSPGRLSDNNRTTVYLLLGIAAALSLLGCANVANLMIFRAGQRNHETAVRKALGASPWRLIRLHLTESWLLALIGSAAGLLIAVLLTRLIEDLLIPAPAGSTIHVPIDIRVIGLTAAVATCTGLLAGLAPAWMAARTPPLHSHSAGSRVAGVPRLRSALASLQLALSLTLLIGALLLVTTVRNLRGIDVGYDMMHVTSHTLDLTPHGYSDDSAGDVWHQLLDWAQTRYTHATVATAPPFGAKLILRLSRLGSPPAQEPTAAGIGVGPDYFATMTTPLVHGRPFTPEEAFDDADGGPVPIVINEALARSAFGTTDVVGRTLASPETPGTPSQTHLIIGVARDVRWDSLRTDPDPFAYLPFGRQLGGQRRATLLVSSALASSQVAADVRSHVARLDPGIPVTGGRPLSARLDGIIRQQRLFATTLTILGALAFTLAALGVYGLLAQTVGERSREFGIRIALGATRADILRHLTRFICVIVIAGTVVGTVLAHYASTFVERHLFGITASEPSLYVVAAGILTLTVFVASLVPALRAMRVEPVIVLKAE